MRVRLCSRACPQHEGLRSEVRRGQASLPANLHRKSGQRCGKKGSASLAEDQDLLLRQGTGRQYPEGTYDLLGRIVRLEQQAEKDKSVDLSKIEIEEIVARTTAEKFKIPAPADFQRTGEPTARHPAAPAPSSQPSAPVDDPIGQGGFIKPPTDSPVQLCVPVALVPSWENPAAGPEMAAFRQLVAHYALDQTKGVNLYRIKGSAFDAFTRAQRSATPFTPSPSSLVDAVPAGQHCPATDHIYNLQRKSP